VINDDGRTMMLARRISDTCFDALMAVADVATSTRAAESSFVVGALGVGAARAIAASRARTHRAAVTCTSQSSIDGEHNN